MGSELEKNGFDRSETDMKVGSFLEDMCLIVVLSRKIVWSL